MEKIISVGIIGFNGRIGKPLTHLLKKHPYVDIVYTENSKKTTGDINKAKTIFLALPPGESHKFNYLSKDKQIIDLSIDHRDKSHWTYGLPEIFSNQIKKSKKIANPGCYATAVLLSLFPIRHRIRNIKIFGVSGVSGRSKLKVNNSKGIELYSSDHKHPQIKEINFILMQKITCFMVFLDNGLKSGLKVNISAELHNPKDQELINQKFTDWFSENIFINKIINKQKPSNEIIYLNSQHTTNKIEFHNIQGTNNCNIRYWFYKNSIFIEAFIDNLIKGGAGQAIQNFNLMNNFDVLNLNKEEEYPNR